MRKVICIYPKDQSTDFLKPVYEQLKQISYFTGYCFDTIVSQETQKLYNSLYFDKDSMLIFLGHGSSNKLYGSVDKLNKKQVLFNETNIDHIKDLDFICIACRSNEFAQKYFKNYMGFGDITSDFSEVIAERNLGDPNYLEWAHEFDITNFRNLFVESLKNAILTSRCSSIVSLYKMLKLSINKQIANLLLEKNMPNYRHLADMLYTIQTEMEYRVKSVPV